MLVLSKLPVLCPLLIILFPYLFLRDKTRSIHSRNWRGVCLANSFLNLVVFPTLSLPFRLSCRCCSLSRRRFLACVLLSCVKMITPYPTLISLLLLCSLIYFLIDYFFLLKDQLRYRGKVYSSQFWSLVSGRLNTTRRHQENVQSGSFAPTGSEDGSTRIPW